MELKKLGERIYQLRTAAGLSQGDLADRLDVSRQSVSKWETGAAIPDLERLMGLCDLFGVTLDALTGRTATQGGGKAEAFTPFPATPAVSQTKVVGYILLAVSLLGSLLLTLIQLYHLLLVVALPVLLCSVLCLALPRRAGYWCLWVVWLAMEFMLVFGVSLVTGAWLFPGFAAVLLVIIGVAAWRSFRDVTVTVSWRRGLWLATGWIGYIALTAGLIYWVYHYGFVGGVFDLLVYYGVSAVMTGLLAILFTYTMCFVRSRIHRKNT
ncbi:MAG: helix-turn-helix transcriptional regulator [Clostridia bacterium]|nr:helix-turn-helix transcriptional regulator [Clostridia bacterium]